jgi:hypothetical protein
MFSAVVGKDRELFGFFDVFPLRDSAGLSIREGSKGEQDISLMTFFLKKSRGSCLVRDVERHDALAVRCFGIQQ